jgi:hypothetical protein
VTNITERSAAIPFNEHRGGEGLAKIEEQDRSMISAAVVTVIVVLALALGLRSSARAGGPLVYRPYNNHHNDASGAREDHLG